MVFGIDDLIIMGVALAGREIYKNYEEKKRAARRSNLSPPQVRSPTPDAGLTSPKLQPEVTKRSSPQTKTEIYKQFSLSKGQTRMLTLKADAEGIELDFSLFDLDEDLRDYGALSYSWEEGRDSTHKIKDSRFTVHGIAWEVNDTLYQAFVSMKEKCQGEDLLLWVDEISIDQSDDDEKEEQVSLMGKVYAAAIEVVVWLGTATPESDHFLSQFEECDKYDENYDDEDLLSCVKYFENYNPDSQRCGPQCTPARDLGVGLMDRRWWRRTWVIQEVMLNNAVVILCGKKIIPLDSLLRLAAYAITNNHKTIPLPHEGSLKFHTANKDNFRLPILTILQMRERILAGDDVDFTEWIEVFHKQDSTHHRDKLYGLYGLADPEKYNNFPITYEKRIDAHGKEVFKVSDETVFTMATKAIVKASEKLDFICLTHRHVTGTNTRLPSWVPDLGRRPHYAYAYWPLNYMSKPTFKASPRDLALWWDDECMISMGYQIDEVAQVGLVDNWQTDVDSGRLDPNSEDPFRAHAMEMIFNLNPQKPQWDALAKTIVCDMNDAGQRLTPDEDGFSMRTIKDSLPNFRPASNVPGISPSEAIYYSAVWEERAKHRWTFRRKFLVTKAGRLGIGPAGAQVGDLVCILHGATVPYILRKTHDTKSAPRWSENYIFLGESYIHGIMDGEVKDLNISSDCFPIV